MKPAISMNSCYAFFADVRDQCLTPLEQVIEEGLSSAKELMGSVYKVLKRQAFER